MERMAWTRCIKESLQTRACRLAASRAEGSSRLPILSPAGDRTAVMYNKVFACPAKLVKQTIASHTTTTLLDGNKRVQ